MFMWTDIGRLRAALVGLLVGTAILFAVGIALEQSQRSPASPGGAAGEPAASAETGEDGEGHSEAGESATTGTSGSSGEASPERILGIDYEAPLFIALAIGISLVLAALIRFRPARWLFAIGIALGLGFAVLDLLEVQHQLVESRMLIALIAVVLAIGHVLVAALSARLATFRPLAA
jgi:hypothetical protein